MRTMLALLATAFAAQAWPAEAAANRAVPEALAPFFRPPPALRGDLGDYRSPLRFDDDRLVRTPEDWPHRRREILRAWQEVLGPWPPPIEKPKVEVIRSERREDFTQRRVRLDVAPNQQLEGWLLVPDGPGPFPAVLVVYYDPESGAGLGEQREVAFGYLLVRRGFVTLSIGSPGGDARKPRLGEAVCQPLSFLAYVAANCHRAMAGLPEVDPPRIGIVGHSYGGKWAMFASCLYEPFACAAWSDGGIVFGEGQPNVNYWDDWYLGREPGKVRPRGGVTADNPRTGAYKRLIEAKRDLHELHALMAPRPFLVSGGSEDPPERWRALNHTVAVNELLGVTDRVAMTNRKDHRPNAESNEQICVFFEHFLGSRAAERR